MPAQSTSWDGKNATHLSGEKKKEQSMRGLPHWFMENMKILVEHGPW